MATTGQRPSCRRDLCRARARRGRLRTTDIDGNVIDVIDRAWNGRAPNNASSRPVLSSDGTLVAFASEATNILNPATSGYQVFLHRRTP